MSYENVKQKMSIAKRTKHIEDERVAKHARNVHSRVIKKRIKEYYADKLNKSKNKFKSLKELNEDEVAVQQI